MRARLALLVLGGLTCVLVGAFALSWAAGVLVVGVLMLLAVADLRGGAE
jgi:hypothetical protein